MLYPFKFEPILKPVIWGGDEITKLKKIKPVQDGIGESWEISGVPGSVSVVGNGALRGKSLTELIETYGAELLGQPILERFGKTFPLLIKFIDARQPLSIQVHPNDELAKKRHNSFGKTEMWYVVKAKRGASLYSGFKKEITPEQYVQSLKDDTFMDYLQEHKVKKGDVFILPAGRVHAIGAGCLIAEIQQTSDITYRIYDYNRKDANGNPRELHTDLAKEAIDYKIYPNYKFKYPHGKEKMENLAREVYFTTNLLTGKRGEIHGLTYSHTGFVIFICLSGYVTLMDSQKNQMVIRQGETVLIPAANINNYVLLTFFHDCQLLEAYIESTDTIWKHQLTEKKLRPPYPVMS